jgi:hypothetical protein
MLLTITNVGMAKETAALQTGVMPIFHKIVIGDGVPYTDPSTAVALKAEKYEVDVIVVEQISAGAVKLHAYIPADAVMTIKEVGLTLSDGTLYGYTAYNGTAGLYKAAGFDLNFYVILSRENIPNLVFTYEPVNTNEIKNTIVAQATNEINVKQAEFFALVDQRRDQFVSAADAEERALHKRTTASFFNLNLLKGI